MTYLATVLSIIFIVSLVSLAGELLYVVWRHCSFRQHASSAPHVCGHNETSNTSIIGSTTKELRCLKPHHASDTHGQPVKERSSLDDQIVDVFKLLDAKGPSRFLCTIKEEEKEEDESTLDVDLSNKPTTNVCMQSRLQLVGEPTKADQDYGNTKMVFSTPCDSPVFFTPVGSPTRDILESEYGVPVHGTETPILIST